MTPPQITETRAVAHFLPKACTLLSYRQAPCRGVALRAPPRHRASPPHHSNSRFGGEALGHGRGHHRKLANWHGLRGGPHGWLGDGGAAASPLRGPVLAERLGLAAGQRPPAEIPTAVDDAFRRDDATAVQGPAVPLGPQRAEIAQPQQSQQLHGRPRHPACSGIPRAHGADAAPKHRRARLAAQQAAEAKLAEPGRGQVPATAWPSVPPMAQRNGARLGHG
jgi:hypothetical protein